MARYFSFLILLLLSGHQGLRAQGNFAEHDTHYRYDVRASVKLDYRKAYFHDSIALYLKLSIRDDMRDYQASYAFSKGYEEEMLPRADTLPDPVRILGQGGYFQYFFRLSLSRKKALEYPLMIISIKRGDARPIYLFDIRLDHPKGVNHASFLLGVGEDPWLSMGFVRSGEALSFTPQDQALVDDSVYVYRYAGDFRAAAPPMSEKQGRVSKELTIDSLFRIGFRDTFSLRGKRLYFAQYDSSTANGLGFRVEPPRFPKYDQLSELIPPLVYITTQEEWQKLERSDYAKKAFDRFWLKMASPAVAKTIIKKYYQRVKEANALFTGYKEGWKTDRGMVYMIYGPPDEVYRKERTERWHYSAKNNLKPMEFSFAKIDNIFVTDHYALIRNTGYRYAWLKKVGDWRKGR